MQIIYDFDGVMFNSRQSVETMYCDLSIRLGITLNVQLLDYCYTHSMADNVTNVFGGGGWEQIKRLPYKDYYLMAHPEPSIEYTIDRLHRAGIKVSICSNRVAGIAFIVKNHGLTEYLSGVVTSKEYPAKPDPTGLLSLIEDDQALFVGDSDIDRLTAVNAGIPFIAYNNPNIEADYYISNHLQILDLTPIKEYGIKLAGGK